MPYLTGVERPSEQLHALLTGAIEWNDAPEAIRSWARFYVYQAARQILDMPTKGERRNALVRIPARVRPHVETEIKRLWSMP